MEYVLRVAQLQILICIMNTGWNLSQSAIDQYHKGVLYAPAPVWIRCNRLRCQELIHEISNVRLAAAVSWFSSGHIGHFY